MKTLACLSALWMSALAGCAGKLEHPERFTAIVKKFASDASTGSGGAGGSKSDAGTNSNAPPPPACVAALFKNTCGASVACHAKGTATIDLVSTGVTGRLLDQKSKTDLCKGEVYIASDGGESLLLDKLTDSPPCGVKMPFDGTKLSAAELKCVGDWVNALGGGGADAGGN